jgi:hypothetical protein
MDGMFSPEIHAISHSDFRIRIPASPPAFARATRELRLGQRFALAITTSELPFISSLGSLQ